MKKIFSFVIVAFAAIALNAAEAVFDFTNPAGLNPAVTPSTEKSSGVQIGGQSFTAGDVTIAFAEPSNNGAKLWTKSDGSYELRFYQPNSFTISSTGANISKIQFVFDGQRGGLVAAEGGEIDATGAWLGNAEKITFSIPDKGQASYINSITVYTGEAPVVKIDTLNVGEMNALIKGAKLSKQACVIGRVSGIDKSGAAQYGNINVWLADIRPEYATDTIEAYRMKSFNNADYKDVEDIQFGIGDTIIFYASEWSYYKDNDVNEGVNGYLVEVIGGGNPDPVVYEEIDVTRAIEIGDALEAGAKTTVKYDVRGYVVSISGTQGLNKLYMADDVDAFGTFVAYQCEIAEGANVVEGSFVSVIGYIEKFQYKDATDPTDYTIEISKGKLTVLEDPSALPNVIAEKVSCKKMMINGQMYIKNGNKLYNVLGQAL